MKFMLARALMVVNTSRNAPNKACVSRIRRTAAVYPAQPGTARCIATAVAAAPANTAIEDNASTSSRVLTMSLKTEMALNPWIRSATKFIFDSPVDAPPAIHRDGPIRQPGAENGRRVMIPKFGYNYQTFQSLPRQNAEIAHAYADSRQQPMQGAIEPVENLECRVLHPLGPFGENDDAITAGAEFLDQAGYVTRAVFAVPIHDDNSSARQMLVDVDQPDSDRALMAQVPPQMKNLYRMQVLEMLSDERRFQGLGRSVVDQQHLDARTAVFNRVIERRK